jgi:hypothetical protein
MVKLAEIAHRMIENETSVLTCESSVTEKP